MAESRVLAVQWLAYQVSRAVCRVAYVLLCAIERLTARNQRRPALRFVLPLFRAGHALSPRSCFPLQYLAWGLHEVGDLNGAVVHYELLLALWPASFEARVSLGEALSDLGRFSEAVEHLERAHHESPRDPRVRRALARALIVLNHSPEAIPLLEEVVGHDKGDGVAWSLLGAARMGANRWDEAVLAFARAYALDANPQKAVEYVAALIEADRYAEAETQLVAALAAHGGNATLRVQLAHVLAERDHDEEAERILQDVLREDPRNLDARTVLASLLAAHGRVSEAAVIADAIVADFPDHENAYATLGWVALKADGPRDALTAFDRALARQSGQMMCLAGRATALHALGRASEAQAIVRSIVDRDSSYFARHKEWAKMGLPCDPLPPRATRE